MRFSIKTISVLIIFFLGSCSTPYWYKPRGYLLFSMMPKGGSPGYNLGWIHGCQSGAGTQFGGTFYKMFYNWTKDTDIISSKPDIERIRKRYPKDLAGIDWSDPRDIKRNFDDYKLVFWDGHFLCRQIILGTLQMAGMDPILPGGDRFEVGKHSIGSVYSLQSKGDVRWGSPAGTGGYW